MNIKSFGIIGGDKRQLYCARSIADDGYGVLLAGFEAYPEKHGLNNTDAADVIKHSDALLLPLPVSKDGKNIFAPYSEKEMDVRELIALYSGNKPVFCGINGSLDESVLKKTNFFRYSSREEFAAANAVPTAEGAIEIAMHEYSGTINGSVCLVAGFGKIGRVLSPILHSMGADVTVAARQLKDRELIKAAGMKSCPTSPITGKYNIIFNTIPYEIFDAHTLAKCASDALVIDLASMPGGIDDKAAARMDISVIHALSLPGKAAPKTAGIIIKNAVYNIIEEEDL